MLGLHLQAALGDAPLPSWSLPQPPEENQVRQMIERIGGNTSPNEALSEALLASGLQPRISFNMLSETLLNNSLKLFKEISPL